MAKALGRGNDGLLPVFERLNGGIGASDQSWESNPKKKRWPEPPLISTWRVAAFCVQRSPAAKSETALISGSVILRAMGAHHLAGSLAFASPEGFQLRFGIVGKLADRRARNWRADLRSAGPWQAAQAGMPRLMSPARQSFWPSSMVALFLAWIRA